MKTRYILPLLALLSSFTLFLQVRADKLTEAWKAAETRNDSRVKTWWFFGYEHTTNEGITADVESLKEAGFGGVVYYDQNHRPSRKAGEGNNGLQKQENEPEDGFSPTWWEHLKFAAREAHRVGLTFELNISNGYVAGGRWIDPHHAMQRVTSAEMTVEGGQEVDVELPAIADTRGYVADIAVVAFPVKEEPDVYRHFVARYVARGKGRNGAMQMPDSTLERETKETMIEGPMPFEGALFKTFGPIGMLQASEDGKVWQDVVELQHMYSSLSGYSIRTTAFPATRAKEFRVKYYGDTLLRTWGVGQEAKLDRWEERAALHSDFTEPDMTPRYAADEVLRSDDIVDLTSNIKDGRLHWKAPEGSSWCIVRFAAVLTGARSKHGRENLLGYECDKLSKEAAELHWNSYMQPILDTLRADGIDWVEGVCMDSHEGGSQNWTPRMLEEFRTRRGYDLKPYLLVLAGYIVDSVEKTQNVLLDLRRTVNDCMRDNYFGTFQRLARENGLTFTAQAIGNGLCITGDAIDVKQVVDKPQTEFWAYQKNGAWDVKDGASACHLYGKPIASAEAMTDASYEDTPFSLKRVADIALANGAQEMVVCATPHLPMVNPMEPYVAGRVYAINRSNPQWEALKPMWMALNRSMAMLRLGKAAPDVLVYLGDDLPMKTLTHRLPHGLHGLDWDVCTGDALQHRLSPTADGQLTTPDGITYKALLIADEANITSASQAALERLQAGGVQVLHHAFDVERPLRILEGDEAVVHTHRIVEGRDLFFLANITEQPVHVVFSTQAEALAVYRTGNGKRKKIRTNADGHFSLALQGGESVILYETIRKH
jgi:hypothetical protein